MPSVSTLRIMLPAFSTSSRYLCSLSRLCFICLLQPVCHVIKCQSQIPKINTGDMVAGPGCPVRHWQSFVWFPEGRKSCSRYFRLQIPECHAEHEKHCRQHGTDAETSRSLWAFTRTWSLSSPVRMIHIWRGSRSQVLPSGKNTNVLTPRMPVCFKRPFRSDPQNICLNRSGRSCLPARLESVDEKRMVPL